MPNDESCHLNSEDIYDFDRRQDYPTISQINRKITENSVNVIFAVSAAVNETYNVLKQRLQGAAVGVLKDDSSNIVDLIQDQYNVSQLSALVMV